MNPSHAQRATRSSTASLTHSSALYRAAFVSLAFSLGAVATDARAEVGVLDKVVSGDIKIDRPTINDTIVHQGSDRAVIDWRNFDILNGQSIEFKQPGANSVALNRITGGNATQIFGKLTANGRIVLVNTSGIIFQPGSQVNVASLVASTADIKNADFNAGKLNFSIPGKVDASIVNKGTITAAEGGLVALVAPGVRNDGMIQADLGTVILGSAQTATIDMYGDNLYSFAVGEKTKAAAVDENGNKMDSAVENNGAIYAAGGSIILTANAAKEIVNNAVNNTGIIEASSAKVVGGTVILGGGEGHVRVAGTVKANGTQGGKVEITGQSIEVTKATIEASAQTSVKRSAVRKEDSGEVIINAVSTIEIADSSIVAGKSLSIDPIDLTFTNTNLSSSSVTITPVHNFTLNNSTITATAGDITINNTGSFLSTLTSSLNATGRISIRQSIAGNIQNAIDAIGNYTTALLTLGSGTFDQTFQVIGKNNFSVVGQGSTGANATILKPTTLAAATLLPNGKSVVLVQNGTNDTISDLAIDGALLPANPAFNAITFNNTTNSTVANNKLTNVASGIQVIGGANAIINRNNGNDVKGSAIFVKDTAGARITGNSFFRVAGNALGAIVADGASNLFIRINSIHNATVGSGSAVYVNNAGGTNQILSNTLHGTGNDGITVRGASNLTVDSNRVYSTGTDGIDVAGSASARISNNRVGFPNPGITLVDNIKGDGIKVGNSNGAVVLNNTVQETVGNGVSANGSNGLSVDGNVIYNTGSNGVRFVNSESIQVKNNFIGFTDKLGTAGAAGNIGADGVTLNGSTDAYITNNLVTQVVNGFSLLNGSNNATIGGNAVMGAYKGIFGESSSGLNITGNTLSGISGLGIDLLYAGGHTVDGNTLTAAAGSNGYGMRLLNASDSTVSNNSVTDFALYGILNSGSSNVGFTSNTISNSSNGIAIFSASDNTVQTNSVTASAGSTGSGIRFEDATNSSATLNNTVSGFAKGLAVINSQNIELSGNTLTNNATGVFIDPSTGITVTGNSISGGVTGVEAIDAASIQISDNVVHDVSGKGITLSNSGGTSLANSRVDGNVIYNTGSNAVDVANSAFTTIANNFIGFTDKLGAAGPIHDAGTKGLVGNIKGDAIRVANSNNAKIENNEITRTASTGANIGSGIFVSGSNDVFIGNPNRVLSNRFTDIAWDAIKVVGGNRVTINGNSGSDVKRSAVNVNGTDRVDITYNGFYRVAGQALGAIQTDGASNLYIFNNQIHNATVGSGSAVYVNNAGGAKNEILNNTLHGTGNDGITVRSASNLTISSNRVYSTAADGIDVANSTGARITGNRVGFPNPGITLVDNIKGDGIKVDSSNNAVVLNNTVQETVGNGVSADGSNGLSVDGNVIYNTGSNGVSVANSGSIQVKNNFIGFTNKLGTAGAAGNINGDGIKLDTTDDAVVRSNRITRTASTGADIGSGIFVANSNDVTIGGAALADGNILTNIAWDGIKLSAGNRALVQNNSLDGVKRVGIYAGNVATASILNNTVKNSNASLTNYGAISTDGGNNLTISNNTLTDNLGQGIRVVGAGDTNRIDNNSITNTAGDAIHADSVSTLTVALNTISNLVTGLTGIWVNNSPSVTFDQNSITNFADGVNVNASAGAAITDNTVTDGAGTGITLSASNGSTVSGNAVMGKLLGFLFASNDTVTVSGNTAESNGNGARINGGANYTVSGNSLLNNTNTGLDAYEVSTLTLSGNQFTGNGTGLRTALVSGLTSTGDTFTGNGIGAALRGSNNAVLSGNLFTNNTTGIELNGSDAVQIANTTISTTNPAGVGLRVFSVPVGTLTEFAGASNASLSNVSFEGGNIAVLLDGPQSSLSFADNTNTFTNVNFYFVLQNNAMEGLTLDASQQTFDGIVADDFTPAELAAAEAKTIDVEDGFAVGNVFYKAFLDANIAGLDETQRNRRGLARLGLFSYAGRTVVNDPALTNSTFQVADLNLSLLNRANPTTAANIANLFATLAPAAGGNNAAALANLSPSAGGANAQALANLAPAAGGASQIGGNDFLSDGYKTSYTNAQ